MKSKLFSFKTITINDPINGHFTYDKLIINFDKLALLITIIACIYFFIQLLIGLIF